MNKIKLGNDFVLLWQIKRNGELENLLEAVNIRMVRYINVFGFQGEEIPCIPLDNGIVRVEITPEYAPVVGKYFLELHYELTDLSVADKDRKCRVDMEAFRIVPRTSAMTGAYTMSETSDLLIGLRGEKFVFADFTEEELDDLKQGLDNFVAIAEVQEANRESADQARETRTNSAISEIKSDTVEAIGRVDDAISLSDAATLRANTAASDANESEVIRESQEADRQTNTTNAITSTNTATTQANTARDEAVIATSDARDAISDTETATSDANVATGKANTATTQANTARDNANASALNADEKATLAETAAQNANNATSDFSDAEVIREQQEQARQANTAIAITNAENAITDVNAAKDDYYDVVKPDIIAQGDYAQAQGDYAKAQGEAIQDDLALKANHGYDSSPKTLKEVDDRVESLESLTRYIGFTLDELSLTIKGSAILKNGSFSNSSFSDRTDYIKCEGVAKFNILFQITVGSTQFYNLAFYDQDKIFISHIPANIGDVRGSEVRTIDVPANAHYFIAQYWNEEKRIEYNVPKFYAYEITPSTDTLFKQIAEISSGLNPTYTQEDLTIKNRYIRYIDDSLGLGSELSSTLSDSTGFLKCNNFSNLTLMQPVWTLGTTGLGFYNKDFELIHYIRNKSGETNTSYETTIEVPENAYYFRTTYWNEIVVEEHNFPDFYVYAGTLAENINELYSKVRTTSLGGSYTVSFTAEKIIVTNVATNGSITFDLIGSDTLSGNFTDNEVLKGGKLIRKVEDEFKVMNVTFDLMSDSAPLQIYTHTTYKVDTEIENDGIEGICSGDMGFLKDENVFVEGNPMIAGFTDNTKTKFALCADYGGLTPHYDKLEEVKYTDIDVVKGERKFAKLSVLKEESPLRLLNQPNGYNATFTFASHADQATIARTKAIFYGTNNEASPTYNTNGLLSYGIKGTMSVFAEGHTSSHAALDNASFKALIDDAYSKGIEIIPHTITYNPDTREGAERVLPFFKDNYNSRNWIDHYLRQDNPSIGHHSKGNDTESPHYIMDLMEQYGFDYSWCYIDTTPEGVVRNQLFEEHYQFRRDLLFKNKKLTLPDGTPMWQYKNTWKMFETIIGRETYNEIEHIQNLIDTCNVWADHCYLTGYTTLTKVEESATEINPKFRSMLSFVKDKKEAGEIWNPTQSEYNDNLAKLMDISIVRIGVGQYKVFSKNEENVNCSFLLKNTFKDVYLNGVLAEAKVSGDNMIFWGDIKQGENTITVS